MDRRKKNKRPRELTLHFRMRNRRRLRSLLVELTRENQRRMDQQRGERMLLIAGLDYHHLGLPEVNGMRPRISPRRFDCGEKNS